MGFRQRPNHKKNSVYYRFGKHQRLSRSQHYIALGLKKNHRVRAWLMEVKKKVGGGRKRELLAPSYTQLLFLCVLIPREYPYLCTVSTFCSSVYVTKMFFSSPTGS